MPFIHTNKSIVPGSIFSNSTVSSKVTLDEFNYFYKKYDYQIRVHNVAGAVIPLTNMYLKIPYSRFRKELREYRAIKEHQRIIVEKIQGYIE